MSAGSRRQSIPLAYRDLGLWPIPDISVLERRKQDEFNKRRAALEMYCGGRTFAEVKVATGKGKSEVHRLLKRCLTVAPNGPIYGYYGLLHSVHVTGYTRTKEIRHAPGSGSGGCVGALTQLLTRFPEIENLLHELYFKPQSKDTMAEARIAITAIHEQFKQSLRQLGFTDNDWPFNTANCGYKSLYLYCKNMRETEAQRAALSRSGAEAARRGAVGNGIRSLMPSLRPYGAVQLDFHKVDAASVFVLANDHGMEFEVPLSRWHFGLLVDEKSRAGLGFCVALELTPSGDSTLELVSSALSSRPSEFSHGIAVSNDKILINQLMPELEYQGFSVLKVDNGWSNAAHEVVNNIIDTVGCAVNFGPTRAWWRRNLIERIFGELTRRGLQRLPSTHGKGPGDTRMANPNAQAAKFRITLSDLVGLFQRCLQEHNLSDSEGLQWTSPLKVLQAGFANPDSGFFPQPLPLSVQAYPRLMMHVEEVTVLGNVKKNVHPYFNLDRHKHTNETLAKSFWLIGKQLIVYLDRRLARIVYATVKDTGEQLGRMSPAGPWAHSDCSWRDRQLMTRSGMARRYSASSIDPLEQTKREKAEQLKKLTKARSRKSSRTALELAKIDVQQRRVRQDDQFPPPPADQLAATERVVPVRRDPFGLNNIPNID